MHEVGIHLEWDTSPRFNLVNLCEVARLRCIPLRHSASHMHVCYEMFYSIRRLRASKWMALDQNNEKPNKKKVIANDVHARILNLCMENKKRQHIKCIKLNLTYLQCHTGSPSLPPQYVFDIFKDSIRNLSIPMCITMSNKLDIFSQWVCNYTMLNVRKLVSLRAERKEKALEREQERERKQALGCTAELNTRKPCGK